MTIKILLADDHRIIREGIFSMLKKVDGFKVVGMADNGREAVQLTRKHFPDIVVMDISMPWLNGIEATRIIKSEFPTVDVIALSVHCEKRFIIGMLRAGATGYLIKNCIFEELTEAIQSVYAGEIFLGATISDVVARDYISLITVKDEGSISQLTSREREVLQLIAEGNRTREIAEVLSLSIKTIETHRRRIMKKLSLSTVADLTRFAIREGLVALDSPNNS